MLILFDQSTPVGIRNSLPEHLVKTAREQGWSTLLNGELLSAGRKGRISGPPDGGQESGLSTEFDRAQDRDCCPQFEPVESDPKCARTNCRGRELRKARKLYLDRNP